MTEIPTLDIPYEELKHYVLETLREGGSSFQFKNLCNSLGGLAVKNGIVTNPNPPNFQALYFPLQQQDENRVREILWDLITERILTIGDYHNDSWPWLSLTEYGKKAIKSLNPIPNDTAGYLARIKEAVPQLDNIIEIYLNESIRTYSINQLLSSTITLGCASERSLLVLIATYEQTFNDKIKGQAFSKKVTGKFIKTQFDEFDKSIRTELHNLPNELRDNYPNVLTGIFQMIRYSRNSAGHPTGKSVDKDTLFANLQVFIPYCKFIYSLIDYFNTNTHD